MIHILYYYFTLILYFKSGSKSCEDSSHIMSNEKKKGQIGRVFKTLLRFGWSGIFFTISGDRVPAEDWVVCKGPFCMLIHIFKAFIIIIIMNILQLIITYWYPLFMQMTVKFSIDNGKVCLANKKAQQNLYWLRTLCSLYGLCKLNRNTDAQQSIYVISSTLKVTLP